MPRENVPARFFATDSRPTSSISSETRRFGMPWVCASASKWLYAERPVCTDFASSNAPTS